MSDECLGLFAKYWQPGQVKTRLATAIGAERAAAVYFQFVSTLLERLSDCCEQKWLAYTPTERTSQLDAILPVGWQSEPQAAGDLGLRMKSFFERRLAAGCQYFANSYIYVRQRPKRPPNRRRKSFVQIDLQLSIYPFHWGVWRDWTGPRVG